MRLPLNPGIAAAANRATRFAQDQAHRITPFRPITRPAQIITRPLKLAHAGSATHQRLQAFLDRLQRGRGTHDEAFAFFRTLNMVLARLRRVLFMAPLEDTSGAPEIGWPGRRAETITSHHLSPRASSPAAEPVAARRTDTRRTRSERETGGNRVRQAPAHRPSAQPAARLEPAVLTATASAPPALSSGIRPAHRMVIRFVDRVVYRTVIARSRSVAPVLSQQGRPEANALVMRIEKLGQVLSRQGRVAGTPFVASLRPVGAAIAAPSIRGMASNRSELSEAARRWLEPQSPTRVLSRPPVPIVSWLGVAPPVPSSTFTPEMFAAPTPASSPITLWQRFSTSTVLPPLQFPGVAATGKSSVSPWSLPSRAGADYSRSSLFVLPLYRRPKRQVVGGVQEEVVEAIRPGALRAFFARHSQPVGNAPQIASRRVSDSRTGSPLSTILNVAARFQQSPPQRPPFPRTAFVPPLTEQRGTAATARPRSPSAPSEPSPSEEDRRTTGRQSPRLISRWYRQVIPDSSEAPQAFVQDAGYVASPPPQPTFADRLWKTTPRFLQAWLETRVEDEPPSWGIPAPSQVRQIAPLLRLTPVVPRLLASGQLASGSLLSSLLTYLPSTLAIPNRQRGDIGQTAYPGSRWTYIRSALPREAVRNADFADPPPPLMAFTARPWGATSRNRGEAPSSETSVSPLARQVIPLIRLSPVTLRPLTSGTPAFQISTRTTFDGQREEVGQVIYPGSWRAYLRLALTELHRRQITADINIPGTTAVAPPEISPSPSAAASPTRQAPWRNTRSIPAETPRVPSGVLPIAAVTSLRVLSPARLSVTSRLAAPLLRVATPVPSSILTALPTVRAIPISASTSVAGYASRNIAPVAARTMTSTTGRRSFPTVRRTSSVTPLRLSPPTLWGIPARAGEISERIPFQQSALSIPPDRLIALSHTGRIPPGRTRMETDSGYRSENVGQIRRSLPHRKLWTRRSAGVPDSVSESVAFPQPRIAMMETVRRSTAAPTVATRIISALAVPIQVSSRMSRIAVRVENLRRVQPSYSPAPESDTTGRLWSPITHAVVTYPIRLSAKIVEPVLTGTTLSSTDAPPTVRTITVQPSQRALQRGTVTAAEASLPVAESAGIGLLSFTAVRPQIPYKVPFAPVFLRRDRETADPVAPAEQAIRRTTPAPLRTVSLAQTLSEEKISSRDAAPISATISQRSLTRATSLFIPQGLLPTENSGLLPLQSQAIANARLAHPLTAQGILVPEALVRQLPERTLVRILRLRSPMDYASPIPRTAMLPINSEALRRASAVLPLQASVVLSRRTDKFLPIQLPLPQTESRSEYRGRTITPGRSWPIARLFQRERNEATTRSAYDVSPTTSLPQTVVDGRAKAGLLPPRSSVALFFTPVSSPTRLQANQVSSHTVRVSEPISLAFRVASRHASPRINVPTISPYPALTVQARTFPAPQITLRLWRRRTSSTLQEAFLEASLSEVLGIEGETTLPPLAPRRHSTATTVFPHVRQPLQLVALPMLAHTFSELLAARPVTQVRPVGSEVLPSRRRWEVFRRRETRPLTRIAAPGTFSALHITSPETGRTSAGMGSMPPRWASMLFLHRAISLPATAPVATPSVVGTSRHFIGMPVAPTQQETQHFLPPIYRTLLLPSLIARMRERASSVALTPVHGQFPSSTIQDDPNLDPTGIVTIVPLQDLLRRFTARPATLLRSAPPFAPGIQPLPIGNETAQERFRYEEASDWMFLRSVGRALGRLLEQARPVAEPIGVAPFLSYRQKDLFRSAINISANQVPFLPYGQRGGGLSMASVVLPSVGGLLQRLMQGTATSSGPEPQVADVGGQSIDPWRASPPAPILLKTTTLTEARRNRQQNAASPALVQAAGLGTTFGESDTSLRGAPPNATAETEREEGAGIDLLAQEVWRLLKRRLATEQERGYRRPGRR